MVKPQASKKLFWAVGLLASGALLAVALSPSPEPIYGGKTISQWLDGGYEQASLALQEVGPAAVPSIFRKLRAEHPVYGYWSKYDHWFRKVPMKLRGILPKPPSSNFDDFRACHALLELGPAAVPALTTGLRDHNPAVQLASAWALGALAERGVKVAPGGVELKEMAHSTDPNVRQRALWAMARCPAL